MFCLGFYVVFGLNEKVVTSPGGWGNPGFARLLSNSEIYFLDSSGYFLRAINLSHSEGSLFFSIPNPAKSSGWVVCAGGVFGLNNPSNNAGALVD